MLNRLIIPVITIFVFIVDRLTKLYIPLPKLCNSGAAFGILHGQTFLLSIFSIAVIIVLGYFTIKKYPQLNIIQKISISLILGGTLGNLFDRINYGYVIDFINLSFVNFPVFNLADAFINIGAGILLITLLARK